MTLLQVYGGVWLDATVFLTAPLPEKALQSDLFFFQRQNNTAESERWHDFNDSYFSWHEQQRVNLLNSILFAQAHQPEITLLTDLMLHFWQTQNHIPHYFFFQILCDVLQQKGYLKTSNADHTLPHQLQYTLYRQNDPAHVSAAMATSPIHKLTYNLDLKHIKSQLTQNTST